MNWKRLNKACEGSFKKFIFLSCNLASSLAIWTQLDILRNKRVKYLIYVNTLKVKRGGGKDFETLWTWKRLDELCFDLDDKLIMLSACDIAAHW